LKNIIQSGQETPEKVKNGQYSNKDTQLRYELEDPKDFFFYRTGKKINPGIISEFCVKSSRAEQQGSQMIAFSSAKNVCVYSFKDMKSEIVGQGNYERGVGFDWTSDGQNFLLLAPADGEYHLIVMDKNFQEEKKIKIPVKFKDGNLVWGLENRALLKGFGRGPFWRVDLETEEWKKVY